MTTVTLDNRGGGGKILLILVAIVIAFSVAVGSLGTLPMTKHAEQGRAGTTMDAEAIRQMIDKRACKPIEVYVCPPVSQSKLICYLKPGGNGDALWAGVIVGISAPHPIITGYVAPYSYWQGANLRDGCYRASRIN